MLSILGWLPERQVNLLCFFLLLILFSCDAVSSAEVMYSAMDCEYDW